MQYPEDTEATRTEYDYDDMCRLASAAVTTDTGLNLTASYTYEDDLLTQITTASTTYSFTYGDLSLRSAVQIGERTLAEYTYTSLTNYLSVLDYGNDDKVQYTYDQQGRVTQQTYEDGDTVTYRYDNNGALATVTDSATGIKTTYYYDFTDRLMKYVESDGTNTHSVGYEYDTINNLTKLVETINGVAHETSYTYDLDNRVTSVTTDDVTTTYSYDGHGRMAEREIVNGDGKIIGISYEYRNIDGTNATTGQIYKLTVEASGFDVEYSYEYDDNGNILSVSDGTNTTSYVYDSAGQLVRENNQAADKTWVWTYDNAGNIRSRSEYEYTKESLEGVTPDDTIDYAYTDEVWGDLLTAYDGVTISYDRIGNPLSDGTWTYTWEHGRELSTMTDGTTTWTYTYNADGLRTQRTNGTNTYKYIYNGSSLVQMTVGNDTLYFTSDTVTYNNTVYYYVKNIQGDIIAILDTDGDSVVQYTYDAWGNILTVSGSMSETLGEVNPLTYRGYVYDHETGLYYLQSRYYDPEVGRFLNADAFASTGQGVLGNNMFCYCLNNPVRYEDSQGNIAYDSVDEDPNNDENVFNDTARIGNQSYKSFQFNGNNTNIERSLELPQGKGFQNFNQLKAYLGPAGNGYHWHHIVEQCQIGRSGFSPEQIHNTSNVIQVDQATHAKITGHYNTTTFPFTNGMSVRNWLTGQPFAVQYEYGINVLHQFGVIR